MHNIEPITWVVLTFICFLTNKVCYTLVGTSKPENKLQLHFGYVLLIVGTVALFAMFFFGFMFLKSLLNAS